MAPLDAAAYAAMMFADVRGHNTVQRSALRSVCPYSRSRHRHKIGSASCILPRTDLRLLLRVVSRVLHLRSLPALRGKRKTERPMMHLHLRCQPSLKRSLVEWTQKRRQKHWQRSKSWRLSLQRLKSKRNGRRHHWSRTNQRVYSRPELVCISLTLLIFANLRCRERYDSGCETC